MVTEPWRPRPDVSVLLPMQEDRSAGERCLRAWTSQELDPARFEIVVISPPGTDPALRRAGKALLRPGDRWIEHRSSVEWELFNAAAGEARAPLLFCTEAHCVPERETLSQMLAHLERRGGPGARGLSRGESQGPLGRLEQTVHEEDSCGASARTTGSRYSSTASRYAGTCSTRSAGSSPSSASSPSGPWRSRSARRATG